MRKTGFYYLIIGLGIMALANFACSTTGVVVPGAASGGIAVKPPARPPTTTTLSPAKAPVQVRTWKATHTIQQILDADHASGGLLTIEGVREQAVAALKMVQAGKPIPNSSELEPYNAIGVKNDLDVKAYEAFYGLPNTIESPSLGE